MAGVMAGTAILKGMETTGKLKTITLTLNNTCNLNCPHCYLQYNSKDLFLSDQTLASVYAADFEHLAIVGKEPLVNQRSIDLLDSIVNRVTASGKTVSIITNGVGLDKVSVQTAGKADYIDISFDGGPATYRDYRNVPFEKITGAIQRLQQRSSVTINALHTLSDRNIGNIDDMMRITEHASFGTIMFSAYMDTANDGNNYVASVSMEEIVNALASSALFMQHQGALFALDINHLKQSGTDTIQLRRHITDTGLQNKILLIEKDPLLFGIIRVTYDDLVLTPYESVNTSFYHDQPLRASGNDLNILFNRMATAV
jgi:sulfatase maturation enzyme AslB (radical SAM superfamily)